MALPIVFIAGKPITLRGTGFLGRRRGVHLELGGHRSYVRAHLRAALALGYEPHVFVVGQRSGLERTELGVVHHVRTVPLPGRQAFIPFHAPFLVTAVFKFGLQQRTGPLIIHGFGIWGAIGVDAARRLTAHGIRARSINSFYTTYAHQARGKSAGWVPGHGVANHLGNVLELRWTSAAILRRERVAYREASIVMTNYDSVDRLLIEAHGNRLIRRMPYASELSFEPDGEGSPVPEAISRLVPRGAPLILSLSRHDPRKGLPVLVDALALLRRRNVPFRACLLSAGPLLEAHREMVARARLSESVVITGNVDAPEAYLRHADIFALPSLQEGSGSLALLEAMQAGLAPVVTSVDGLPEDVTDEVNGLLVPPGDAEALAAALRRLLDEREFRRQLAAGARATFEARFTADRFVRELCTLYKTAGAP